MKDEVSISVAVLEKHEETVVKLVIVEFGRIIPQSQVGPVQYAWRFIKSGVQWLDELVLKMNSS
jgi:hypothetical protein